MFILEVDCSGSSSFDCSRNLSVLLLNWWNSSSVVLNVRNSNGKSFVVGLFLTGVNFLISGKVKKILQNKKKYIFKYFTGNKETIKYSRT